MAAVTLLKLLIVINHENAASIHTYPSGHIWHHLAPGQSKYYLKLTKGTVRKSSLSIRFIFKDAYPETVNSADTLNYVRADSRQHVSKTATKGGRQTLTTQVSGSRTPLLPGKAHACHACLVIGSMVTCRLGMLIELKGWNWSCPALKYG